MLLGNADVVVAVGKALLELDQPRAFAHGRRDAHQPAVVRGHVAEPLAEDLREGLLGHRGGLDQPHLRIKLAGPVVGHRVGLGQLVALALLGHHVQELRAVKLLEVLQRRHQRIEVVAVDRPDVVEAELLEQRGRHHHALGMLLEALGQLEQRRRGAQHALADVLGGGVEVAAHQLRQVAVERAHWRADRHVVVVQDHQQLAVADAGVVERLEGHAGGQRAVADDRHRMPVLALLLGRHRHAQRRRDAGRRMGGAEGVVLALAALREARDAAELAQRRHALAPAGQDLVRIGLVAHVPHQPVVRRVEDMVQRDRELDRAEVGAQVAAGARNVVEHAGAHLGRQLPELGAVELADRRWIVKRGKQRSHGIVVGLLVHL